MSSTILAAPSTQPQCTAFEYEARNVREIQQLASYLWTLLKLHRARKDMACLFKHVTLNHEFWKVKLF
jgi:hypothetical protein